MTTQDSDVQIQQPIDEEEGGLGLIDIIVAIGEEKWVIFWIAFICTVAGLGYSLSMTNIYTARTTILLPQQGQSSPVGALASLGGLAGLAGGSLGMKSSDEMYIAFMNSATIQNGIIERFKLQSVYNQKKLVDARDMLSAHVRITSDKKAAIVTIEVNDKSPEFAAQLANSYVDELRKMLERLAVTDAQQRRLFFEKLIVRTKEALGNAELKFKNAQETSGIISLEGQATSAIKASAELRAQIALREVQIQAASSYATPQNADMQRLAAELSGLRTQLDKLEKGTNHNPRADKSENALANLRAFREVKYQEAILETLIKQYELARVDEAKEGPLIQQIDIATPPEYKSKPKRSTITIFAAMVGLMLGLGIVFIRRGLKKANSDPVFAETLKTIWNAWRIKLRND
jgi:tyrosine-protein kinase Etk/Wzc